MAVSSTLCAPTVHGVLLARSRIFHGGQFGFKHTASLYVYPRTENVLVPNYPREFRRVWSNRTTALFLEEGWA